jgi:glutamyl-tRNA reductase
MLETCHRVEAYLTSARDAERLAAVLPPGGRVLTDEQAAHHAMRVAVGRDSVVVGEDQILHQVRESVDAARAAGTLDPVLERLFAVAVRAGRTARSWRQGPPRSLADIAFAFMERQAGPMQGRDILIVGAGRMGRVAARAAAAAGASVAVTNRSADAAQALAAEVGGRTVAFDPVGMVNEFAGVLVALSGPWPISPATIAALAIRPTVVVDLSVPSAISGKLANMLGDRLVTADDLAVADAGRVARDGSADRLDALVVRSTAEFIDWERGRHGRATADALVQRADRAREAELAALWRRLPDLEPDARDAIERMTRHLAERLLREPLERLGRDPDERNGRTIRDIFAL